MKAVDLLSDVVGEIAAWLLIPLVGIMCVEVFSRYVLGSPTTWSYELAYMLTGANYLLAFAVVLKSDANMRVDILYNAMPARYRAVIDLCMLLFILCPFIYIIMPALTEHFVRAWVTGESTGQSSWNPPAWPFRLIYLVSFGLLGAQVVSEIIKKGRLILRANVDGLIK